MLYADVCVNTPLGARVGPSLGADTGDDPAARTFTYQVPERLERRLQPGHLVWVLFRGRRVQAIVLSIRETPPDFEVRVDSKPSSGHNPLSPGPSLTWPTGSAATISHP